MDLPKTIRAVQNAMGVASDGKPGLETWEAIRNQLCPGAERAPVSAETLAAPHASEKMPSKCLQARVVDQDEQKQSYSAGATGPGLCSRGSRANERVLCSASWQPVRSAPPSVALSRRSLDRTTWPKRGRRHRGDRAQRIGGAPRI
jgi:hypothetical protein